MAKVQLTVEDLYREAQADLVAAQPHAVLKWAGLHARAAGRLALANERMRELASLRSYVQIHAANLRDNATAAARDIAQQAADEYIMQYSPDGAKGAAIEVELQDATAALQFAASVRDLIAARTATMKAVQMRVVEGGRR